MIRVVVATLARRTGRDAEMRSRLDRSCALKALSRNEDRNGARRVEALTRREQTEKMLVTRALLWGVRASGARRWHTSQYRFR
jgi:hypothetical protein